RVYPHAMLVVRILKDDMKSLCHLGLKFGVLLAGVLMTERELGASWAGHDQCELLCGQQQLQPKHI
ncbi:hypothetical protein K439DRAFT_1337038, partial [Ramaria rubella]